MERDMKKMSEKLLSVVEAAGMTGRKESTWRRDILERRIAVVRIGRSVRIPVEVVTEMIQAGYCPPARRPAKTSGRAAAIK
jgi:excisionase family DNA binding protein